MTDLTVVRTVRVLPQGEYMHFGVYRIGCRHAGCEEPAYYTISWPLPHTNYGFGQSDRCADHALEYARRWSLSFPGLKAA